MMTPAPEQNPKSICDPRRRPASRTAIFVLLAVTLAILLAAVALTIFNLRGLREWAALRPIVARRTEFLTMANYPGVVTSPARAGHLRACYKNPAAIDFSKISWDLYSRPTPFVGYAPEPGDQGEGHFNAQQLRNRADLVLPKPAGVYRIFLTGGSQAYGVGAPSQDETIPAYLERALNERGFAPGKRVEVFNAAVCGWASGHERIFIENRAAAWQPDLVIDLTGGNDAHWSFAGDDVNFLRTYEDELYFAAINAAMRASGAKDYPAAPPAPAGKPFPPARVAARFTRNMRLAALALEPAGARLVVALQPTLSTTAKKLVEAERLWLEREEPAGKVDYVEQCFAAIAATLKADGPSTATLERNPPNLQVVSLRDVFAQRSDAIFFDLFHLGDKGNELVARRLAEELIKIGP